MSDDAEKPRRRPLQARSKATVDAILEAATRILEADEAFTTNHVAERAGVSVGTLYQYFPDKTAIVHALAARERKRQRGAIREGLETDEPDRAAIRAMLTAFDGREGARRAILAQILRTPTVPGMGDQIDLGVAPFIKDGERAVHGFVLSRAIMGVVRAAVMENSPLLGTHDLEDALVRLVRGYRDASPKRSK